MAGNAEMPAQTGRAAARDVQRALIVKFGSIGDVIMAIPGAAALHSRGFSVDWIVSETVAPVLALYPWIRTLPIEEGCLLRGAWPERLRAFAALRRQLQARVRACGGYDLVATLYYDRRYDLLTRGLRARRRVLLSRTDRRFTLLPGRHHTDEYARVLLDAREGEQPFGLAPIPAPSLPPSPLPPRTAGRPQVVLVPGGARNALRDDALRRWPVELYRELAGRLLEAGCEIVLAGGPGDLWTTPFFDNLLQAPGRQRIVNLIGRLDLLESLALFDASSVVVTHDTGPLHLAGLTGVGIVALFGPTDPRGRLPRRDYALALWGGEGFGCRPCYDGRDYAPCLHNGCMTQITPEAVAAQVLRLFQARESGAAMPPEVLAPLAAASFPVRLEGKAL